MADGLSAATADRIAAEADVARATFFRHFESKEFAVAEGITAMWIAAITDSVRRQPRTVGHGPHALAGAATNWRSIRGSPTRSPTSNGRPANR